MKLKFLVTALLFSIFAFAQKGTVTGTITDKDMNNEALSFATVMIKGTTTGINTDEQGKYTLSVTEGNHVLVVSFLGYESVEIPFSIAANETKTINQALGSKGVELKDIVVKVEQNREKETALLVEQKKAVEIKQSIGAQELSRKGVSDVEEGLTKMTGITKVESRGLFVRGLEDRYNNLLVNDLAAPSNNPFKKIVPLDLFPTDIVGVIETYKTFNPNIYGDFAGGTFNIQTLQNKKDYTKISIGVSGSTNNNLRRFLLSKDADNSKGFFGLEGNDRELPKILGNVPSNQTLTTEQSLNSFKSGWDASETKSPLNSSLGILHSDVYNFNNASKLGYILSFNFDNTYSFRDGVNNTFNPGGGNYDNHLQNTQYRYKTSSSALAGLNYKTERFNLNLNSLFLRSTESLIQDQFGYTNSLAANPNKLIRLNQFEESNYINSQLFGSYNITKDKNHTVKAGASFVKTSFQQPDRKFFTGTKNNDDITISYGGNNFLKQYLDINGNYYFSGMMEYTMKFGSGEDKQNKISVGYNGYTTNTKSSYRFISTTTGPTFTAPANSIDTYVNQDLMDGDFSYRESSNSTYKVKLNENVNAGYANLFLKLSEKLEMNAGVRAENTQRETKYRNPGSFTDPYQKKVYEKLYFLPSLNTKYSVNEKSNLRLAVGQTITKPVTMEAFPLEYVNGDGTVEVGNKNLVNSQNINADLKYELFPSNKEMFAVGVFGKNIDKPIERTFMPTASSGGQITTYINSDKAVLFGAEIEFIFDFQRVNESLKDLSLGFNTSLMTTKVTSNNNLETYKSRELQGASKWIINSDLKYQFDMSKSWSNTMSLVYNVFGKRIYSVGTANLDHIYELPVQRLDFVWTNKISNKWEVKFSADNILNPKHRLELGDANKITIVESSRMIRDYKKGVGFSLNMSYTF